MMTTQEAWEAGLPGTYMNGEYYPAPLCLRCLFNGITNHPSCVLQFWRGPDVLQFWRGPDMLP